MIKKNQTKKFQLLPAISLLATLALFALVSNFFINAAKEQTQLIEEISYLINDLNDQAPNHHTLRKVRVKLMKKELLSSENNLLFKNFIRFSKTYSKYAIQTPNYQSHIQITSDVSLTKKTGYRRPAYPIPFFNR